MATKKRLSIDDKIKALQLKKQKAVDMQTAKNNLDAARKALAKARGN